MTDKLSFQEHSSNILYLSSLVLISLIFDTAYSIENDDSFINSQIDNYILYFDEWRFDWDHLNDFDNDYHKDWTDIINTNDNNDKMYGCTHNLQAIN